MDDVERGYLMAVAGALVWTPRTLRVWLNALGSPRAVLRAAARPAPPGLPPLAAGAQERLAAVDRAAVVRALDDLRSSEAQLICEHDPAYPKNLLALADAPPVLYVRGTLHSLESRAVAVVGSRAATTYGRSIAAAFAGAFVQAGACVVSGLARGIDAAAHKAAVAAGGPTVAVVGSGLCALYPPYHSLLADEIVASGGAIVSEFPPRMQAAAHHFPMRNRLVAALASATIVVEAGSRSGALITARLADELGRQVFAVPGDVGRPTSEGTNALIKDGIALVTSAQDVMELLGWCSPGADPQLRVDHPLLDRLTTPCSAERLAQAAALPLRDVIGQLAILEIDGAVERLPDGRFAAVKRHGSANHRSR